MRKNAFRPFIMFLLLLLCSLFYYFGELVDWAAWDALRASFFYGVHDVHRLLFLAPIIYAGYHAGIRGAVIITLVSFVIFLPRAFFISPFPDPLLRMVLFTVFAGVIGSLVGAIRNQASRSRQLEAVITAERDKLLKVLEAMADGAVITGPDYIIRFMNSRMLQDFGDGIGLACHRHLRGLDAPCRPACRIQDVINNGETCKWECGFPHGRIYEIMSAPCVDTDGTVCQLSVFRDISGRSRT